MKFVYICIVVTNKAVTFLWYVVDYNQLIFITLKQKHMPLINEHYHATRILYLYNPNQ